MRIGMIFPAHWAIRSSQASTWRQMANLFQQGLAAQAIETVFIGTCRAEPAEQQESQPLDGVEPNRGMEATVLECLSLDEALEQSYDLDILHTHDTFLSAPYSRFFKIPVITSLYDGGLSTDALPLYRRCGQGCSYVSSSNTGRSPYLDYIETVYPGIDAAAFQFRKEAGNYLLCPAPIRSDRGIEQALAIARHLKKSLFMTGAVQDWTYFEKSVAPHVDGRQVRLFGSLSAEQRNILFGEALAVLRLFDGDPVFPLDVLEANACGTPVITINRGIMPELVIPGANGLLVENAEEAMDSVDALPSWDRTACRRVVEERFSARRMVEDYAELYRSTIRKSKPYATFSKPPWGLWMVLEDTPTYKVKRVEVLPGKRLSYQKHFKRCEHWMVVQGEAVVTLDGERITLRTGEYIDIPFEVAHRIENPGTEPMVFIEVQQGSYFGEDDIIRLEDDYGRKDTVC